MPELLNSVLQRNARNHGAWPALAEPGRTITYSELDSRSGEIADELARSQIEPGARVGIFRRKSIDSVCCIYAVLKAGCAYVPLDPKIGPARLMSIVRDADLEAICTEPALANRLDPVIKAQLIRCVAGADGDVLSFRDGL